ncbi:MAG: ACP S-malonyltransferase [Gammaproteobacteria bacterium]|jgi:[acyl-carrier-protein] S-malonyltransferase
MSKKIAFVFPGQGSQSVGMLAELAGSYPCINETFTEASTALGFDLWDLVKNGPEEKLNQTTNAQPALLAAGYAVWRVWQEASGTMPSFLAGHSLGEYTALVCAKALDFSSAIKLVAERGRLMQEAVPEGKGAMVAVVGLDNDKIIEICKEASHGQILTPANYNSIGQTVLAGEKEAALRAVELAEKAGAKLVKLLAVSVPSHCSLMLPAGEKLVELLAKLEVRSPKIPVLQNADVLFYAEPEKIKDALVRQLSHPVRWVEIVQYFAKEGVEAILECGPGKVLTGLNKRIAPNITTMFLGTSGNLQQNVVNYKL